MITIIIKCVINNCKIWSVITLIQFCHIKKPKEKDYQNAIEQPVFVSLYAPIEGDKEWLGILKSVDDDTITMEVKEKAKKKTIEIPRNKIAKARHAVMI